MEKLQGDARNIENSFSEVRIVAKHATRILMAVTVIYFVLLLACVGAWGWYLLATVRGLDVVAVLPLFPMLLSMVIVLLSLFLMLKVSWKVAHGLSPFTEVHAKRFHFLGICLFACFLIDIIDFAIFFSSSVAGLSLEEIWSLFFLIYGAPFLGDSLLILSGAVLGLGLSYVFKYGTLLQQLSDDTV